MTPQADILTITLNPAVDLSTSVSQVIAGPKLYCAQPRFDPGGGGVNVARAVCKLGGAATAFVVVGGLMGDRLLALLNAEAVPTVPFPIKGETRQSFAVTDESNGAQYRFSVPGPHMTLHSADLLYDSIAALIPAGGYVVLSGSLAPSLPVDFPRRIKQAVAVRSAKLIVDISRKPLDALISDPASGVHLLRIDQTEAAAAAGHPLTTRADSLAFADDLVRRGVADMVVTGRGAEGSALVTKDQRFFCYAPVVTVRSKIGAGDAFVGAMTLALARGSPPDLALQAGVAASSATVETPGTALCDPDRVKALLGQCRLAAV